MLIIGLAGAKRSGKDTVVKILGDHYGYHNVIRYGFADPIYDMLETFLYPDVLPVCSDTGEIDKEAVIEPYGVKVRTFLQTLGTEWGRDCIHKDVWAMKGLDMLKDAQQYGPSSGIFVFSDVRFDNEAKMIREQGGKIVRILRLQQVGEEDTHRSESGIDDSYVDYNIANTGTLSQFCATVLRTFADLQKAHG